MLALPSSASAHTSRVNCCVPEDVPGCCGVLLAPGYLMDAVGAVPTACAPWVLCMDFVGRCPLPQPHLRAVLTGILMEDATWLWAESEGVSARAHPRDLHCFGGSLAGLGAQQFPQTLSLQAGSICQPWEEADPAPVEPLLTQGSPREPINPLPWVPPRDC